MQNGGKRSKTLIYIYPKLNDQYIMIVSFIWLLTIYMLIFDIVENDGMRVLSSHPRVDRRHISPLEKRRFPPRIADINPFIEYMAVNNP